MGKRKSRAGMTGLSRFVSVLTQDQPDARGEQAATEVHPNSTGCTSERDTEDGLTNARDSTGKDFDFATADAASTTLGIGTSTPVKGTSYDARGLVPFYSDISDVPEHLRKYFSQRMRYFSLYDKPPGCLLDEEGWYSVTPERIADQIAERCRCDTLLDAFCGVGGNAIAFAKTCERVIALDVNPTRLALARHNAQIYGVADRIEFIQADYISFARTYLAQSSSSPNKHRKIDAVFLSPPWGGPSYLSGTGASLDDDDTTSAAAHPTYSLSSIQPIHGKDLFSLTRKITPNIAYYLPRNTDLSEISMLLNAAGEQGQTFKMPGEQVEVEEEWMGNKLKALTCYFGGLAASQEHLF